MTQPARPSAHDIYDRVRQDAHDELERPSSSLAFSGLFAGFTIGATPLAYALALSELGSAGVGFDQRLLSISYGGVTVCRDGVAVDHDAPAVTEHMEQRHLEIACNLGLGSGRASVLTNDLTHAYVDENMGTS